MIVSTRFQFFLTSLESVIFPLSFDVLFMENRWFSFFSSFFFIFFQCQLVVAGPLPGSNQTLPWWYLPLWSPDRTGGRQDRRQEGKTLAFALRGNDSLNMFSVFSYIFWISDLSPFIWCTFHGKQMILFFSIFSSSFSSVSWWWQVLSQVLIRPFHGGVFPYGVQAWQEAGRKGDRKEKHDLLYARGNDSFHTFLIFSYTIGILDFLWFFWCTFRGKPMILFFFSFFVSFQ